MTPNELKSLVQEEIVDILVDNNGRGYFQAVTGFGKTRVAILSIKRFLKRDSSRTIHVVVPRKPLKEQWDEICVNNQLSDNVFVYVANTYCKKVHKCDYLVLDEAHRYTNDESKYFSTIIDKTKWKFILALSATFDVEKKKFLEDRGIPHLRTISMEEALENNFISDFDIFIHKINPTKMFEKQYRAIDKRYWKYFNMLGSDWNHINFLQSNKDAQHSWEVDMGWERGECGKFIAQFFRALRDRKNILYDNVEKIRVAEHILSEREKDRKIITFSEYSITPDKLHKNNPKRFIYHSKISNRKKQLTQFLNSSVGTMLTAKALNEGLDDDSINTGLLTSYTSKSIQLTQQLGRVVRYVEGKKSEFHILCMKAEGFRGKKSQEEKWLNNALNEISLMCENKNFLSTKIQYVDA